MENEVILTDGGPIKAGISSGSTIDLPDDDPMVIAMGLGKAKENQPAETTPEVKNVDGTTTENKPDAATSEIKPPDGVKVETKTDKVPYTDEELKSLINDPRFASGEIHLDTSRIADPAARAFATEMQGGLTRKRAKELEELKREKDSIERQRQEIASYQAEQKRLKDEQRFQQEKEELGEEEAARLKRERDTENRLRELEYRLEVANRNEASEVFRKAFVEVAPKYQVPTEQGFEDMAMSFVWATNELRKMNNQPGITLEDGVAQISDMLGFTNPANFEKIIAANPKNKETYDQKVINDYLQKKAAGPTVVSSTQASVPNKSVESELEINATAYQNDPAAELQRLVEARLKQN